MNSKLLVFAAILILSVGMNSCQKSEAITLELEIPKVSAMNMPGQEKTLVQIDIVMDGQLEDWQTQEIQTIAEDAIMALEAAGHPSMNPRIVIGGNIIYPRGGF